MTSSHRGNGKWELMIDKQKGCMQASVVKSGLQVPEFI